MSKEIEIRVVVPQQYTKEAFDAICGARPTRMCGSGVLYDPDSFCADEQDWDGPEWTPIDSEDM